MPNRTRAYYREFLRIRAGVKTPRERWTEAQIQGWEPPFPVCPPYGLQPSWQLEPSDYLLNSVMSSACNTVLRECRVVNALHYTDIDIPAQTAQGPYIFRFDALPGFADGSVLRIRRSYITTDSGVTWTPVLPAYLPKLDVQQSDFMNDATGVPYHIAVDGMLVYLMPGPQTDVTLRLNVGSGVLAPLTDEEGYDGIPEAYDDAINYIALAELAVVMASDAEMQRRLAVYAPFAKQGIDQLTNFFDNAALDNMEPGANWESPGVTRYSRRN